MYANLRRAWIRPGLPSQAEIRMPAFERGPSRAPASDRKPIHRMRAPLSRCSIIATRVERLPPPGSVHLSVAVGEHRPAILEDHPRLLEAGSHAYDFPPTTVKRTGRVGPPPRKRARPLPRHSRRQSAASSALVSRSRALPTGGRRSKPSPRFFALGTTRFPPPVPHLT